MLIRHARIDDIDTILALWKAADAVESVTDDPGSIEILLRTPTARAYLAEDGSSVVGSIIAGFDGWRGSLYRLAVLPSHRRRGVALDLVREAERFLIDSGARKITAMVMRDHEHALRFWEAGGYDEDPRLKRYVKVVDR